MPDNPHPGGWAAGLEIEVAIDLLEHALMESPLPTLVSERRRAAKDLLGKLRTCADGARLEALPAGGEEQLTTEQEIAAEQLAEQHAHVKVTRAPGGYCYAEALDTTGRRQCLYLITAAGHRALVTATRASEVGYPLGAKVDTHVSG